MKLWKLIIAVFVIIMGLSPVFAQEYVHDLSCDIGDIQNTEVLLDGVWWRADSVNENKPVTQSTGPYPVRSQLVDNTEGIISVRLFYDYQDVDFPYVEMTIDGNGDITGEIPALPLTESESIHYFLRGYDSTGDEVEIDEIAYTCNPYTHGDPFSFDFVAPVQFNDVINFFDDTLASGSITGVGPGNSESAHAKNLRKAIVKAQSKEESGNTKVACQRLGWVEQRTDGNSTPPDSVEGAQLGELHAKVVELMDNIGC